jgi:hippurate hydrolase
MKAEAKDCFLGCVMLFLLGISTAIAAERGDSSGQSALHARVDGWVERELPDLLKVYRHLHANPELSLEESKTSALVAKALGKAGYSVETGIGGYGVIGILRNGPGPTLLIRGDMDGLPVVEATGLRYASVVRTTNAEGVEVGVMHACGHDVHITNLLGTARLLAEMVNAWRGTLVILAQPAEELGLGALHMIDDGLFDRIPRPDHAIALHVAADLPAGSIGFVSGWAAANVDWVKITMVGRGGHGARPHEAIDPIVMSAHLVTALQSIVSRQIDPSDPAVVTVGSIHGGSKSNVIPDRVKLELTVRSYSDEVRARLLRSIETMARGTEVFRAMLAEENVREIPATMTGEDFGRYARAGGFPSFLYRLGSVSPVLWEKRRSDGRPLPSIHSSLFAPEPEQTLRVGLRSMTRLALDLLDPAPN